MKASTQPFLAPEEAAFPASVLRSPPIPLPQAANDPDVPVLAEVDAASALFSPLEWAVIGIGRRDRAGWFAPDGLADRIQRLLFGIRTPRPFADRRLEALRRLALATTRPGQNAAAAIRAADEAGLTPAQIRHLQFNS